MSSTRDAMRILFAYQCERRETWQVLPGEIASHLAETAYSAEAWCLDPVL